MPFLINFIFFFGALLSALSLMASFGQERQLLHAVGGLVLIVTSAALGFVINHFYRQRHGAGEACFAEQLGRSKGAFS